MSEDARRFRNLLTSSLNARPLITPKGVVADGRADVQFGTRVGAHAPTRVWAYERAGTALRLFFGFYQNGTPHDLICKVVAGGPPIAGEGATIQFNATRSIRVVEDGRICLQHAGPVTVGTAIARAKLVEFFYATAPDAARELGDFEAPFSWPFRIGTADNVPALLDTLFEYAYLVEQAKRALREQVPLEPLLDDSEQPSPHKGQGFARDAARKRAVELYAMDVARQHFESLGYAVEDRSAHYSYDLFAQRRGRAKDVVFVEVKGTCGDGSVVLLTANEVEHARRNSAHCALVVVHGVRLTGGSEPKASGGAVTIRRPWNPDEHSLAPTAFRCGLDTRSPEP